MITPSIQANFTRFSIFFLFQKLYKIKVNLLLATSLDHCFAIIPYLHNKVNISFSPIFLHFCLFSSVGKRRSGYADGYYSAGWRIFKMFQMKHFSKYTKQAGMQMKPTLFKK